MGKFANILTALVASLLPVKNKTALFSSFYGQYNDNPKYICDEFYKRHPDYKVFWVVSSKCREVLPDNYIQVHQLSSKYYYLLFSAQVIVDNHMGMRYCEADNPSLIHKFYNRKRKGQFSISTWHGTALKRIGTDSKGPIYTNNDVLVLGNKLIEKQISELYPYDFKTVVTGSPRNDILFNTDTENVMRLKKKLDIPQNKKVVVYAPTFRSADENYGIDIIGKLNFEKVLNRFNEKFGGDWCLVLRVHHVVLGELIKTDANLFNSNCIVNGNIGDDMGEYMACADALITDYSSNMFDFLVTEKPCFMYAPDFDNYKDNTRGFVFDYHLLPFSISQTSDELCMNVLSYNEKEYADKAICFMNDYGYNEDGYASKRVVDIIDRFITDGKEEA